MARLLRDITRAAQTIRGFQESERERKRQEAQDKIRDQILGGQLREIAARESLASVFREDPNLKARGMNEELAQLAVIAPESAAARRESLRSQIMAAKEKSTERFRDLATAQKIGEAVEMVPGAEKLRPLFSIPGVKYDPATIAKFLTSEMQADAAMKRAEATAARAEKAGALSKIQEAEEKRAYAKARGEEAAEPFYAEARDQLDRVLQGITNRREGAPAIDLSEEQLIREAEAANIPQIAQAESARTAAEREAERYLGVGSAGERGYVSPTAEPNAEDRADAFLRTMLASWNVDEEDIPLNIDQIKQHPAYQLLVQKLRSRSADAVAFMEEIRKRGPGSFNIAVEE